MSDIFNNEFADISEKDWRKFALEASRPLVDAPADTRVSRTADFAKQLEKANIAEQNAYITTQNARIDDARNAEREAKASAREAKASAKELTKLGLPDVSEQRQLPGNWFDAKKATGYDNLPFTEQSKIYNNWLDQAHVRLVTADRSKAATARAELEARVPAPTKPKAEWYNTDIVDKMQIGYNSMIEGGAKVAASYMPAGDMKDSLYSAAAEADAKQKELRKELNPETLDAEKATAFRKQELVTKYGGEDNIPAWEGFKQGVSSMTQGGVLQTVGNVSQSLASSLPSVAGNAMRIGGAALTATGAGAVAGVPLMAAGTAVASLGGAVATAGDVGGQAYDDAMALAKSRGLNDADARDVAERAGRNAGAAGGVLGFVEGLIGAKLGAGSAVKTGLKAGAKKLGIETVSEGVAEGAGQVAVNATLNAEGANRSLMRGVAESTAQGAIGGLGMGVGGQALASVTGAEAQPTAPTTAPLPTTQTGALAGTNAASAAINNAAAAAQQAVASAQQAVATATATGDDAQIAAATVQLQAAQAQAQAVTPAESTAGNDSFIERLKAASDAQDALDAAIAKGDPAEIEAATAAFNTAVSATNTIATQAAITPAEPTNAAPIADPVVAERERMNGVQIRDMLDKVEAIPQARSDAGLGDTEAFDKLKPLAGAIGRADSISSAQASKKPWAVSIKKGVSPIEALAKDDTLEPAQRQAAIAVLAGYKVTGTAMPVYDPQGRLSGRTAGDITHLNISPSSAGVIRLNRTLAGPATIIHEYAHGLTAQGLRFLEASPLREHKDVLKGLDAIMDFLRKHPSVTKTRSGQVYAASQRAELLAEMLSGRVLPLTSNITVQDILDTGNVSPAAYRGLELLGAMPVTPLRELFVKARDFVLNAMGIAAAKKGSVSDAILAAGDYTMEQQRKGVEAEAEMRKQIAAEFKKNVDDSPFKNDDTDNLIPGYSHLGKNADGNFATSLGQLTEGLQQSQPGVFAAGDGTMIDPADSIASMAERPAIQQLLSDKGFDGFMTEAGEKFKLLPVRDEAPQDKELAIKAMRVQYQIQDASTSDAQRLRFLARFMEGNLAPDMQALVNATGAGLTVRSALEAKAPWAEAVHNGQDDVLQLVATGRSDVGDGAAGQARAVLRMFAESGTDMPRVIKIKGLIPFDGAEALGSYDPRNHTIELSDLADPSHVVHEYIHAITQRGIDAMSRAKEGKGLEALMKHMITAMRTVAVRQGDTKPYALNNMHEMMADMFKPEFLRIAAQTPIGVPSSKLARDTLAQLLGEKQGTLAAALDAIIRNILNFIGVKTVPDNMATILARVASQVTDESRKAVNDGVSPMDAYLRNEEVLPALAPTSQAFKSWFGNSQVVNGDGTPRRMYTGTSVDKDFSSFKMPRNGVWFTMWPDSASDYARDNDSKGVKYNPDTRKYDDVNTSSRVIPVYLNISNPYTMTFEDTQAVNVSNYKAAQAKLFDRLRAEGYDGVKWSPAEWVAIASPTQIKSAVGNNGNFSPASKLINEEVLPVNTAPLSQNTLGKDIHGRIAGADYINNIAAGVNVQPSLNISRAKALMNNTTAENKALAGTWANKLSDAVHDSQGPAKRWVQSLPISAAARERIINILYLAPGKRDNVLNDALTKHGGNEMTKALAEIKKSTKGLTVETITSWAGHWITANHVAEKNAGLIAKRAEAHRAALAAVSARPNDFRLQLAAAKALQAYKDQVAAVSSTNLDAGALTPHVAGVAGGLNNAQAAALMANVESQINVDLLKKVAEHVYDLNAFRLSLDIETGRANPEVVGAFLNLQPQDIAELQALSDARANGTVTEAMRASVRTLVRSEYVPMTGHPLASIDGDDNAAFGTGAAQPNTANTYSMEGRTSGIADNGIATTMTSLIRSASFAGFADFTTGIAEAYDLMSADQRNAVGLSKESSLSGLVRSSDNMLIDGRKGNKEGYVIQDRTVLDSIRKGNVEDENSFLNLYMRPVTKAFAYLVTQANPIFGPKNLVNDMIERSIVASTREYYTETGNKVTIGATDIVANGAMAMSAVRRLVYGTPDYSIEADRALRDLVDAGGMSISRDSFMRSSLQLAQQVQKSGAGTVSARSAIKYLDHKIDNYNKLFDMVSPLSSYLALRHAGVAKVDAAGGALDLMNFRKKGAHMSLFTSTIAFAQPAVTGGANMIKLLGTSKGQRIAVKALLAFTAINMLAEAGADDDEGGNLLRQLPDSARNANLNFQVGGYVISVPTGFGITRFANTVSRAGRDMYHKDNSLLKTLNDIAMQGIQPAITPFEDTDIKDMNKKRIYEFTPTAFKPFMSVGLNVNPQGGEIDREKWLDKNKYRHMQGSKNIAPEYRSLAAALFDYSGGMFDITPEATSTLVRGYSLGIFKAATAELITNPHKEEQGKDTGIPILGSLIAPVAKPLNEDAWKGQVRKAQEDMDEMHKQVEKLKADGSAEGRVAMRELMSTPEYKLMLTFDEMDKRLRTETAAVTRNVNKKQITATAGEQRKQDIKDRRTDEEAQFLIKWRKMKGLE
jgi:Large polyvalent protein associated domain 38/ADP-Ribosyltransferase in polyvalent proteins